jgi:hypothetical protein
MRFTRYGDAGPSLPRGASVGRVQSKQWFREWLAERPRYVILGCGHHEDMSLPTLLAVKALGGKTGDVHVLCERCNQFSRVVKSIGFLEYAGIKPVPTPELPLY